MLFLRFKNTFLDDYNYPYELTSLLFYFLLLSLCFILCVILDILFRRNTVTKLKKYISFWFCYNIFILSFCITLLYFYFILKYNFIIYKKIRMANFQILLCHSFRICLFITQRKKYIFFTHYPLV